MCPLKQTICRYVDETGLEQSCPTNLQRVTEITVDGENCYVVRPYVQCVTYAQCNGATYVSFSFFSWPLLVPFVKNGVRCLFEYAKNLFPIKSMFFYHA
jgi:hypothetical protein